MSTMTMEPIRTAQDIQLDDTISDMCGVTMNDSVEGRIVAQVMAKKPGVMIKYYPAMIRIDGHGKLEFDMAEIGEALGRQMDPYTFQVEMSHSLWEDGSVRRSDCVIRQSRGRTKIRIGRIAIQSCPKCCSTASQQGSLWLKGWRSSRRL